MAAGYVRDLVYDVGMCYGEDTEYYLKKGFRVIAFEADPDLARACRKKFAEPLLSGDVTIVEGAIVDPSYSAETVQFYKNMASTVWGTTSSNFAERNSTFGANSVLIQVPRVNFLDCLVKYGVPYYLKVDIEGMDMVCLRALLNIEGRPAFVSIESDKIDFEKVSDELKTLRQLGYTSFQAVQQATVHRQTVPRPPREGVVIDHVFQKGASGLFGKDLKPQWKTIDEVVDQYKRVFAMYRVWGEDYGLAQRFFPLKVVRKGLSIALNRGIPGWYDTHARHSSESGQPS